jgi:glycine/D-amino acid oxidase-like deaminating enzyme
MELVAPADVQEIVAHRLNVRLVLDGGFELSAEKVIVCSGYEALPQIPKGKYKLISTWALATKPLDADRVLPARPIVWEQSDPYLYLRTTRDNRIVAGGEDEDFNSPAKRDALIARKTKAIMRKLKAFIPAFDGEVDFAWAGTFADSPLGLPTIGAVPGMPNVFATLGSGGNGITFSAIAAEIAREWVLGRRHPDAALYDFS